MTLKVLGVIPFNLGQLALLEVFNGINRRLNPVQQA